MGKTCGTGTGETLNVYKVISGLAEEKIQLGRFRRRKGG
jgi:hypothetical protein